MPPPILTAFCIYIAAIPLTYALMFRIFHGPSVFITPLNHKSRIVEKDGYYIVQLKQLVVWFPFFWAWQGYQHLIIKKYSKRSKRHTLGSIYSDAYPVQKFKTKKLAEFYLAKQLTVKKKG